MGPTLAELARTAVARARAGTLTTYGRGGLSRTTLVGVSSGADATVVVRLRPDCPAALDLLARPLARVQVAAAGAPPVELQGGASRLRGRDAAGLLGFQVQPGAVRVGRSACPVTDYVSAAPDPLAAVAPAVLAHLARSHAHDLRACVRATGQPSAQHVEPTGLDRHGLSLVALCDDGVARLRLGFPYPVAGLDELPPGLGALLRCACGPLAAT